MDPLQIEENLSDLRQPYLLLTFSGWSDAAGVATAAGRFLVEHLEAECIAQIDPEDFYSFADQRPQAQYNDNNEREIIWPANEFFLSRQPQLEHDVIIGVGVEPHLKWRTFTDLMMDLTQRCKVFQTVTLGALWADVLYSAPVRFSGSATDPELSRTLGLGTGSRYEGPTGMIGVLHDKLRRNEFTSASLWANMPYYISVTPNPKGMLALVRRGLEIIGLPADFPDLEEETREFEERVAEAISQDPKIAAHVKKLERQQARDESGSLLLPEGAVSGDDLAAELQRYLREQRGEPEESEEG